MKLYINIPITLIGVILTSACEEFLYALGYGFIFFGIAVILYELYDQKYHQKRRK
jgi:hypothetical protein